MKGYTIWYLNSAKWPWHNDVTQFCDSLTLSASVNQTFKHKDFPVTAGEIDSCPHTFIYCSLDHSMLQAARQKLGWEINGGLWHCQSCQQLSHYVDPKALGLQLETCFTRENLDVHSCLTDTGMTTLYSNSLLGIEGSVLTCSNKIGERK